MYYEYMYYCFFVYLQLVQHTQEQTETQPLYSKIYTNNIVFVTSFYKNEIQYNL